uniref:helix-turn-helix transcriptional regulator n=1 Tax=uncultured Rhizobium sp. TaxID=155567 RepID=UPI00262CEE94|nr:DNA-binding protein [uncultured Rhizobium sp.]
MKAQVQTDFPVAFRKFAVCRREAASLLDISPATFDEWVRRGWMPKGVKLGALRRWDTAEIWASWHGLLEQNTNLEDDDAENPFDHTVG